MFRGACRGGAARFFALLRIARVVVMAVAGSLLVAGCMTSGPPLPDISTISLGSGTLGTSSSGQRTVAFETIDGPPEGLFRKLVAQLARDANARQLAIVSRDQTAQYRIWGYLAAHVQGQRTTITWVWDVFTADHERVARLSGDVPGAPSERAWAAADDAVIGRLSEEGMTQLAAFLSGAAPVASVSTAAAPLGFLPLSRP
jgi:hypothetical protein